MRTRPHKTQKRTGRTRMPRNSTAPWTVPGGITPWGGHMYNPPAGCIKSHCIKTQSEKGITCLWIDVSVCNRCPSQCGQFVQYKKTWRNR